MTEYWFARRFPVGHSRNTVAPVNWKGWAMFGAFIAAMLVGAIGFVLSALAGKFSMGIVAFVSLTCIGGGLLLMSVAQHSDNSRTVEDYAAARTPKNVRKNQRA